MDSIRIFLANTGSWLATIITFSAVENFMRLAATFGSICVSVVSVWWIIKQARKLDGKK